MIIDDREIYRYLGLRGSKPDKRTAEAVNGVKAEVISSISPKSVYKEVDFKRLSDSELSADGVIFKSVKLVEHLRNSDRLLVFAATLGVEGDIILKKYMLSYPAKAVIAQAVLAAATECYCDEVCKKISRAEQKNGYYLRPRFSPGYSDFDLTEQKKIFSILDIYKRIGVSLSDSCLMSPSKSVTAFIGLSKDENCNFNLCKTCGKAYCDFRR